MELIVLTRCFIVPPYKNVYQDGPVLAVCTGREEVDKIKPMLEVDCANGFFIKETPVIANTPV